MTDDDVKKLYEATAYHKGTPCIRYVVAYSMDSACQKLRDMYEGTSWEKPSHIDIRQLAEEKLYGNPNVLIT